VFPNRYKDMRKTINKEDRDGINPTDLYGPRSLRALRIPETGTGA
jgi:hypothetical protein